MKQIWNKENIQEYINNNNQNCEVLDIERRNGYKLYVNLKCTFCGFVFCKSWDRIKQAIYNKRFCLCSYCNQSNKDALFLQENEDYLKRFYPMYVLKDVYYKKSKKNFIFLNKN